MQLRGSDLLHCRYGMGQEGCYLLGWCSAVVSNCCAQEAIVVVLVVLVAESLSFVWDSDTR